MLKVRSYIINNKHKIRPTACRVFGSAAWLTQFRFAHLTDSVSLFARVGFCEKVFLVIQHRLKLLKPERPTQYAKRNSAHNQH